MCFSWEDRRGFVVNLQIMCFLGIYNGISMIFASSGERIFTYSHTHFGRERKERSSPFMEIHCQRHSPFTRFIRPCQDPIKTQRWSFITVKHLNEISLLVIRSLQSATIYIISEARLLRLLEKSWLSSFSHLYNSPLTLFTPHRSLHKCHNLAASILSLIHAHGPQNDQ